MKRFLKRLALLGIVLAAYVFVARFLFPLPDISDRPSDSAIPVAVQTTLGALQHQAIQNSNKLSGVALLALASRLALIDNAEASVDAQYYIWHDDFSGILLLDALDRAARRGVRVRLLLDDNGVPGLDTIMATLNAQENFEIRLFNPSSIRSPKALGYSFSFLRMNRRMHNKSIIVDGAATILGGRNIGDEYFEIGTQFFKDLDAFAVGAIVPDVSAIFDQYWNSRSVYELERIVTGPGNRQAYDARVTHIKERTESIDKLQSAGNTFRDYLDRSVTLEWTRVDVVADDPAKGEGNAVRDELMIARLGSILGDIEERLDLVSPYFIPGDAGSSYFAGLANSGKEVNVLTNALNTTDVLMVHAGYAKYRRNLLEAGVKLYELKLRGDMTPESERQLKPLGLSGASLHAKTFAVDQKRVFIGSFNFDPRSALLNCEMGLLIDSPDIATSLSNSFDASFNAVSYRPVLTEDERMVWYETLIGDDFKIWQQEPGATVFQQISLAIIGILPVEWML